MKKDESELEALLTGVQQAIARQQPLVIRGGNSKSFYGHTIVGTELNVKPYSGIIQYEPTELCITARAGTSLRDLETELDQRQQMLPFEPPHFGPEATVGGMVACGLSGPRRPYAGAVRDAILGIQMINGKGEYLRFGGQVMKNVAGYDISRLMTGAMGTLGVIAQVSIKVIPKPALEKTLVLELKSDDALRFCQKWSQHCVPISATYYDGNRLYVRIAGTEQSIQAAYRLLGGEFVSQPGPFWLRVREQTHEFFQQECSLWRITVPRSTALAKLPGQWNFEWNGGLRWLSTSESAERVQSEIKKQSGHAVLFRNHGSPNDSVFPKLQPEVQALHERIKAAFDPHRIFNRGRMYSWC